MAKKKVLRFIHVGKCGGSTIQKLLKVSPLVADLYDSVVQSHVCGITVDTDCDYLICLRNPISRAISAYEWRRKLVLLDPPPNQSTRFRGEFDVLNAYDSFSSLASKLYQNDNSLNEYVARDFQLIHHLRESISFYLKPLLPILNSSNVYGIVCQENLSADCINLLGIAPYGVIERKNNLRRESPGNIGDVALYNLKRYLQHDYQCILHLWTLGVLNDMQLETLIFNT
ncbi:hypothetical protein OAE68_00385 [Synechococcus sp. AH-551-A10]|nr:hypothetical protein [Synechococcus sp. AH-551-A10]MDB4682117.1 hypothetical protein [Synechococcus sp. AH-551-A10]